MAAANALTGRVALVTGASRGIGRAIAVALAGAGADVAVNYRADARGARDACNEIGALGRKAVGFSGNVANAIEAGRLVKAVERDLGSLAILVNNAGIARVENLNQVSEASWTETIQVNLCSAFFVTQAALPSMRTRHFGRIVNISSVAAHIGGAVGPHYAASKAGLIGLTHYYAAALAREGITANAIAPGPVATRMLAQTQLRPEQMPMGRFGTPEEIAEIAVMLASNGYITGQTIIADGGRVMT